MSLKELLVIATIKSVAITVLTGGVLLLFPPEPIYEFHIVQPTPSVDQAINDAIGEAIP